MTPRTLRMLVPMLLAGCLAVGCSDDDGDNESDASQQDGGPDGGPRSDGGADAGPSMDASGPGNDGGGDGGGDAGADLTDPQVLGILTAVNSGEITTALVAIMKPAQNPEVLGYAMDMRDMHTAANEMQSDAGMPATSPEQLQLQAMTMALTARLEGLPAGAAFDLEYMRSQQEAHTMVLTMIDTRLIPSASVPLRAVLTSAVRPMVLRHRDEAAAIVRTLTDGGVGDGGTADGGADAGPTDGGLDASP